MKNGGIRGMGIRFRSTCAMMKEIKHARAKMADSPVLEAVAALGAPEKLIGEAHVAAQTANIHHFSLLLNLGNQLSKTEREAQGFYWSNLL